MDIEDELTQDLQDSESKKKPYNKKKRATTLEGRYEQHLQNLLRKKERQYMRTVRSQAKESTPVWITVDHPGLEASVRMKVLVQEVVKTVAIEWTESNMRALYRMCQNDISRGEKREPKRKGAKLGGAERSGFVLRKTKGNWRMWMAKGFDGNKRHLPFHPPTLPSIHPPLHTHAHHKREKII